EIAGPEPRRMTKAEVLKALGKTQITDYALEDVHLLRLNRDAATLTYKLTLKGALDDKSPSAHPAYVSSTWVRQDAAWLSVFRQATPLGKEPASLQRITNFEATLTPNSVRYLYKGTTKLEDVHAML